MAMTALDKERQRQRALNQTAAFMQHGHTAPQNPVPKPVYVGPKDMKGREFKVGMKVIRPVKVGNGNGLKESVVTHIAGPCVYVDGSARPLGKPERCYILG